MQATHRLALAAGALAAAFAASAQLKPSTPPAAGAPRPAATASAPAATPGPANPGATVDAEKETAGKVAAHGWLALLDRRDWGTAWDTSSMLFRQTVPLASWMDGIPKVREPFGALLTRQPSETIYKTTLPGRPDGHYVTTNFTSKFEKKEATEIVTAVLDTDGRWRVLGYSVR